MSLKAIIDSARAVPEYAGLAIFSGEESLFTEHIQPDYALRLKALYCRASLLGRVCEKSAAESQNVCAIAGGFTFHIYGEGGLTIMVRLAGRFIPLPRLAPSKSDYLDPLSDSRLPTRDTAHLEAEVLLRQYDLMR